MKAKNIFFIFIILILIFSIVSYSFSQSNTVWDNSFYDKYSIKSFFNYSPANESINFDKVNYPLLNAAIFYATNNIRTQYGLKELKHSIALEKAAFMHSKDMAEMNFFSHYNNYDSSKYSPFDRMAMFGVSEDSYSGENIASSFGVQYESGTMISTDTVLPPHTYNSFAKDIVDYWMTSPGHRANILDEYYIYLGCGAYYFYDDIEMFMGTQNFSDSVPN